MSEKALTLEQYRTQLRNHDWTFYFSDDPRVYRAGEAESTRIRNLAIHNGDDWKRAYNTMHKMIFGKPPFVDHKFPFPDVKPATDETGGGDTSSQEEKNSGV